MGRNGRPLVAFSSSCAPVIPQVPCYWAARLKVKARYPLGGTIFELPPEWRSESFGEVRSRRRSPWLLPRVIMPISNNLLYLSARRPNGFNYRYLRRAAPRVNPNPACHYNSERAEKRITTLSESGDMRIEEGEKIIRHVRLAVHQSALAELSIVKSPTALLVEIPTIALSPMSVKKVKLRAEAGWWYAWCPTSAYHSMARFSGDRGTH